MYFDAKKMHSDILKRLNKINKSQRHLKETSIGVERSTLYRLSQNKHITMETFLILVEWLDKDANYYIKKDKTDGTARKRQARK